LRGWPIALLALLAACPARNSRVVDEPRGEQWTSSPAPGELGAIPPARLAPAAGPAIALPIEVPGEAIDRVEGGLQTSFFGQEDLALGARGAIRILVERETSLLGAEPAEGAEVWVALGTGDDARGVFHGTTDAAGTLDVDFAVPGGTAGRTLLTVHVEHRASGARATHSRQIRVHDAIRVLLTTDKPMYQPGQIIHLRALALSSRETGARGGFPLGFLVEDARGNKMFRKRIETSAQGIASLDFPLADQVVTGPWKVSVADADGNVLAERTVTVERYVLPKFQVGVSFDRTYYRPGEVVSGTIDARYFFGKPVSGGDVAIEARVFDVEMHTFARVAGRTDGDGVYGFEVTLPRVLAGSDIEGGNARVMFEATVTDAAEHAQTSHGSVVVSPDPIALLVMPESGRLAPDLENRVWIAVARPDGTPLPGTVTLELPGGSASAATDELGIARIPYRPGSTRPPVRTGDDGVARVSLPIRFVAASGGETVQRTVEVSADVAGDDQVLLRLERAVVRSGDRTRIEVLSTRATGTVFLDVVQGRQTLLTRSLDLRDGAAGLDLAIPPEIAGTLEIHAYLLRRDGRFVRDGRVMLVEPADELRIDIEQSRPQYLPGEHARIRFAVTDVAGRPKAAALGVIIVDEAVYALQEMQPGLEKVYFLLEKEILTPRYELHFAPGGVSVEETVKVRDLPEVKQRAAMILLAAADPEPPFSLADNRAAVREVFRTAGLGRIYDALEQTGGFLGARTLHRSGQAGRLADDALDAAVAAGLLSEEGRKAPSGRDVTVADLEGLDGGLEVIDLAPRAAWWGVLHTLRLVKMWAELEDAWCDGGDGWEGNGWYCIPDDILDRLTRTRVPDEPRSVKLAREEALTDPWGRRYVVREVSADRRGNTPEWSLARIEVLSKGPDGRLGTADDVGWTGFAPDGAGGGDGEYADYRDGRAGTPDYYAALTPKEAEWAGRISAIASERMEGRWEHRWREQERLGGFGGGPGGVFPMAAPAFAEGADFASVEMTATGSTTPADAPGGAPARIRQYFPETLLWAPEVITDADGKAEIELDMADSITTWRLSILASAADGALGSRDHGIVVFQPFFVDIDLPVSLTQNDEVSVPIAVYNYLETAQTVELELLEGEWFQAIGGRRITLTLQPQEVTARFYRIRAKVPGVHALTVYATGESRSDAVRREIRVTPDGVPVESTFSDSLVGEITHTFEIPEASIPGSQYLEIKVYPGAFAQAIENLDSMLQMPSGCFEQTSSSTYPNLLILDYLKRTETITPEIQMKAEQYVQLGYQRLVTFECQGGGFEWFGNTPAHLVLTAYGLREFVDMSAVYPVDPDIIERTRRFLLDKQAGDGSWTLESTGIAEGAINRQQGSILNTTAYIAWALAASGYQGPALDKARAFLARRMDEGGGDPYSLALLLQVFAGDADHGRRDDVVARLMRLKTDDPDGGVFWRSDDVSSFGSSGDIASIETTALVVLGLLQTGLEPNTTQEALDWLIRQKDALGNWSSTQATILTLKALIQAALAGNREVEASVEVIVNGTVVATVGIDAENADVMHLIDATGHLRAGANTVTVASSLQERVGLMSQVTARSWIPWPAEGRPAADEPLVLKVDYDRSELATGDVVRATVTAEYRLERPAENVIIDLGIPPGFDASAEDLQRAVDQGKIARFELTPRQIIIYVAALERGQRLRFDVGFTARYPLRARAPSSSAYLYYDPAVRSATRPVPLVVTDAE
jgi:hypothetical protein